MATDKPKPEEQSQAEQARAPEAARSSVKKAQTPAADERNVVEIGDHYPDADAREQLAGFWRKYRLWIIGIVVLSVGGFTSYAVARNVAEQRLRSMEQAYREARASEDWQAFVNEYPNTVLAGKALVALGHEAYAVGDYARAAEKYRESLEVLEDLALAQKARVGLGVAQIRAGEVEAGRQVLATLASDENALNNFRAQAAYHLAYLAAFDEDVPTFYEHYDLVQRLALDGNIAPELVNGLDPLDRRFRDQRPGVQQGQALDEAEEPSDS